MSIRLSQTTSTFRFQPEIEPSPQGQRSPSSSPARTRPPAEKRPIFLPGDYLLDLKILVALTVLFEAVYHLFN